MSAAWLVHPEWALLAATACAALAALVVASWWRARRRARRLLGDARVVGARRLARDLALVAALVAIAAAALGPRLGTRTVRMPSSGVDVVLLVDVSRSMDAADVPPSRLARARALAEALLGRLGPGDRAALAAFAGRGVLLTPLTADLDALAELLAGLDGDLLADRSSDLDSGAAAALRAFEAGSERPRVVALLSDGEDPTAGDDAGAAALARAGVRLVAIALGAEQGALVPAGDAPLLDRQGRPVRSLRDAARLERWTRATGGAAFTGDRWGAIDLAAAAAAIRRDAGDAPGATVARRVPAVWTTPLAGLAFALLWLEWTGAAGALARRARRQPAPRRAPPPRGRAAAGAAAALAALAVLALGVARADEAAERVPRLEAALRARPGDAALLVGLGVARAEAGDRDGAAHALRAAALTARDPALAALAWYDLGVLALDRRELEPARDAFFDALALAPDDEVARFNLEWTLRALEAEPPASSGAQGDEPDEAESERPPPSGDEREERAEAPEPAADEPRPADASLPRVAPPLAEDEVERWLSEVGDAAGQALRAAAGEDGEPRRGRAAIAW